MKLLLSMTINDITFLLIYHSFIYDDLIIDSILNYRRTNSKYIYIYIYTYIYTYIYIYAKDSFEAKQKFLINKHHKVRAKLCNARHLQKYWRIQSRKETQSINTFWWYDSWY